MMESGDDGAVIEFLFAHVNDTFWLLPLHSAERRFFLAKYKGQSLVFLRTAQSSRGMLVCGQTALKRAGAQGAHAIHHARSDDTPSSMLAPLRTFLMSTETCRC